jgi:hypothetical protein
MRSSETVGHTYTHGDSRAKGSYEDTSIWVPGLVDIHAEVDPAVHPGYMMMQEDTRACMSIQEYTVMRGSSQGHTEVYSENQGASHPHGGINNSNLMLSLVKGSLK